MRVHPVAAWLLLIPVLVLIGCTTAEPLPVIKELPTLDLEDHHQRPVTLTQLSGQPWVADFVFTRCPGVCPMLSTVMSELAEDYARQPVRWVSISVDPEHDTPQVLADYAERHDAGDNWWFLTGDPEQVTTLVRDGFMLVIGPADEGEAEAQEPAAQVEPSSAPMIAHSNRFVLVDADNRIRGYYDAFDQEAMKRLRHDLDSLL